MLNALKPAVTVLIADKNSAFCAAASRFIAALPGYRVVSRPAGPDDVMAAYALHKPDVVLMNFAFGGDISGLDLVRRLKHRLDAPWVILVAPVDDPAYSEHGTRAGADGCIPRDAFESALPQLMDRLCSYPARGLHA